MRKEKLILFLFLLCFSCTHQPKAPAIHVSVANNDSSVLFIGIDPAILGEIGRNATPDIWQNLIPVYRMPIDTDMKDYQLPQPGIYKLIDSTITFTPDTPFVKGQTYFIRYFELDKNDNMWDYVRGKKKVGEIRHIDLIFKK